MAEDELQQQNEEILATGDAPDRRMEACTDELRTSTEQLRPQITELERAEMAVEERLQFETLLSRLSTRFLKPAAQWGGPADRAWASRPGAVFGGGSQHPVRALARKDPLARDPLMDSFGM